MPILSVTRTYADTQTPVQADIDNFVDDIEIATNVTKFDDDNFQNGGITGSTKLIDRSISTATIRNNNITNSKIADSNVTDVKIADDAVTTAKIANANVTTAKLNTATGKPAPGMVIEMHSYNGTVSIPRGWMLMDGDIVNEANYEAIHGAGTYTTDGIASSPLLNKYLPNMVDKYAIGASATTQTGVSAITSVGNSGNTRSIAHTHNTSHGHQTASDSLNRESFVAAGGVAHFYKPTLPGVSTIPNTTVTSDSGGSSSLSIRPESIQMMFIMRVI